MRLQALTPPDRDTHDDSTKPEWFAYTLHPEIIYQ
jgi:hypothetical protein